MALRRTTSGNVTAWIGLSAEEVEQSRTTHGSNVLTPPPRTPWWKEYLRKFDDPVIRILMIAAAIAVGVGVVDGSYVEGVGIIIAIFLATFLAFLNEHRAAREFDILNKSNDEIPVKVVRFGVIMTVPRKDLVVGDVALVELGEEVPADGDLLEAVSLQVDESRLTGESEPVTKKVGPLAPRPAADSAYPPNRLLRGTTVVDGHGVYRIIGVGDETEIGRTARAAAEEHDSPTPLNRQLERLSKLIGIVAFGVAAALFCALVVRGVVKGEVVMTPSQWTVMGIIALVGIGVMAPVWLPIGYDAVELAGRHVTRPGWLRSNSVGFWLLSATGSAAVGGLALAGAYLAGVAGPDPETWVEPSVAREYLRYFMVAVTVIVVAVPEGLAMSVTLSLAYSMRRMTATHNLVRRMHACETIGAATVICSDKTGTLTLNEMRVVDTFFPALAGRSFSGKPSTLSDAEYLLAEALAVNSTANLSRKPGQPAQALGNPTEGALLLWLDDRGTDYLRVREAFTVTDQLTFSPERKFMATLGMSPRYRGFRTLLVKGAPEVVLSRCSRIREAERTVALTAETAADIEKRLTAFQERGMRVLGFGFGELPENPPAVDVQEDLDTVSQDLTWLGFAAIADPVRPDVPLALAACQQAGIDVKMVTGDNSKTAAEIGRQIGLADPSDHQVSHITGPELSRMDDSAAMERVRTLKIVSRARPADKFRLVDLLRRNGEVVAVTGDGTNDAPALNLADVGLAMGKNGTSVAKEASDIILLDDSFTSIVNAVKWGRSLYQNIQRFVVFQLTINVTALCIVLLGPFIGIKMPLTVTQMLWVNLIMDTFAALALAAEPPHDSVMAAPPRDPARFILTRPMAAFIFGVGLSFLAAMVAVILYIQKDGVSAYELTVFFTIFVMLQFWNLFNARTLGKNTSAFSGLLANKGFWLVALAILAGQFAIVQFGGPLFRTVPLAPRDWLLIAAGTSGVLWAGEAYRAFRRAKQPPAAVTAAAVPRN